MQVKKDAGNKNDQQGEKGNGGDKNEGLRHPVLEFTARSTDLRKHVIDIDARSNHPAPFIQPDGVTDFVGDLARRRFFPLVAKEPASFLCPFYKFLNDQPPRQCLVPAFDGALFSLEWRDALWDRFYTAAPKRQRQSVEQYKIVKRA